MSVDTGELEMLELVPLTLGEKRFCFRVEICRRGGFARRSMCFGCYDEARWIFACNGSSQGQVGPSTVLSVPGVLLEDGWESPIGADLPVLLVDMDASASANLRVMEENEDSLVSFSEDDPFALPEVRSLIALAFSWVQQQHVAAGQENPWYTPEVTAVEEDTEPLCKKDQNSPSGYGPVDMDQCPSQRSQLRPLFMLRCSRFFRRCQRISEGAGHNHHKALRAFVRSRPGFYSWLRARGCSKAKDKRIAKEKGSRKKGIFRRLQRRRIKLESCFWWQSG